MRTIERASAINGAGHADSLITRESLLNRLRDVGDDSSWRTFFDTYWQLLYSFARKNGLSDAAAQDVVQETIICVARKMPEFRYEPTTGSFKQWLLLITRRRIHDHLRGVYRLRAHTLEDAAAHAEARGTAAPGLPPDIQLEATWEEEWRDNILQLALGRVRQRADPKQYQVFDCCVLRDMRPSEVAVMLGLNAAQVYLAKHRVSAAVKRAAAQIEAQCKRG